MVHNVFLIMPAYNAGGTIEAVFDRISTAAQARISRYVVVDDGSTDGTQNAISRIAARLPNLVRLRHEVNRGYGAAEKTLLNYALAEGAEVAILVHSDGQYSPEKIPDMLEPFDSARADIVQGSRMLGSGALRGGMPFYKYVANKSLTALANLAFGMQMAEYYSGYMAYNRVALQTIPYEKLADSFHFDLQMLVMARIKGLRIQQVPIPTIYAGEVSHLRPIKYGLDVLSVIRDYRRGRYHAY